MLHGICFEREYLQPFLVRCSRTTHWCCHSGIQEMPRICFGPLLEDSLYMKENTNILPWCSRREALGIKPTRPRFHTPVRIKQQH